MASEKNLTTVRLVLLGGFLGAGKTTLIQAMGEVLATRGMRYGVITNDQGEGLIDTATAKGHTAGNVAEVTGGCFCCKLDDLVTELTGMCADVLPDVIFAEPVGSCTDLIATVVLPLQRIYNLPVKLAPYAVTLDPRRAAASLGIRLKRPTLTKGGGYIYRKQIEEAEWHVINKSDLLDSDELEKLTHELEKTDKCVWQVSAQSGENVEALLDALLTDESQSDDVMDVDYERYGKEEAEMGWYNATLEVTFSAGTDATTWLKGLAHSISSKLAKIEMGHFKLSLDTDSGRLRAHQVLTGEAPEIVGSLKKQPDHGTLLMNLRAEADPTVIKKAVQDAIYASDNEAQIHWQEQASFKPGQPVPTHRITPTPNTAH